MLIEIDDVSVDVPDGAGHQLRVLDHVRLELTEHRVGVVGANGSGKSTLARLLNGLVLPSAGRVLLDRLDTSTRAPLVRRRVGFIFSDPDSQIIMPTVVEDVAFGLRRRRLPPADVAHRVAAALAEHGLTALADRPSHLLSSGQKQLLALASVLVTEPDLLVLDEPTTLLDLRHTRRFAAALRALPQQVVLVTHDLGLLSGFDRVLVMDAGRVVADGGPDEAIASYLALLDER